MMSWGPLGAYGGALEQSSGAAECRPSRLSNAFARCGDPASSWLQSCYKAVVSLDNSANFLYTVLLFVRPPCRRARRSSVRNW